MEISQEKLNASYVLDLPCFKFRGTMTDKNEHRLSPTELKEMLRFPAYPFARAIVDLALALKGSKSVRAEIREKLVIPETIFSCDPTPNALTTIQGAGTVQVNFGLFLTLSAMPHTIAWVLHFQQRESMPIDEIMNLVIPPEVLDEINRSMEWWKSFYRDGVADADAILSSINPEWFESERYYMIYEACQQIFTFITFHEMAHWFQTVFLPNEWEKLTRKTKNYLISWLSESEDNFLSKERQDISLLFKKYPEVLESWAEEVQADILAVENCINYFAGSDSPIRVRKKVYAAQAIVYSLLIEMMEVFYTFVIKKPFLIIQTHPQSLIRQSIFRYIGAKELKLSQRDFIVKEWGIGTFITIIISKAMDVFVHEKLNFTGSIYDQKQIELYQLSAEDRKGK